MFYQSELERIRKELAEKRKVLETELSNLPAGELLCTDDFTYRRYYQRLPATGNRKKEHRYGIKNKPELLSGLTRKKYVEQALAAVKNNELILNDTIKRYVPIDEESVMSSFLAKFPELGDKIYGSSHSMAMTEWNSVESRIDNYHPESLGQIAMDGTRMRSKNEVYISSRLDHYGIIYKSDCPTGIAGLKAVPDFTILRKIDSKIIYWEHLGMMDDNGYRTRNNAKLRDYERAGIVPWDNLILTYDTAGGGLRANLVEAMIKAWLL